MKSSKTKIPPINNEKKTISLALQGGGAHGAFTWGVLDRLLEENNLHINAISATSAGAMNAAVMISGLANNNRDKAKEMLEQFWRKVSINLNFNPMQNQFWENTLGLSGSGNFSANFSPVFQAVDFIRQMLSPYQFNFWDINPLRDIINETINFDKINKQNNIKFFVNATNVKTSKIRIFSLGEINDKVLLASSCLPYLSQSIPIDDEHYWDGGFSGNPSLSSLIRNTDSSDVVIIQIIPLINEEIPTKVPEIIDRVNEISFNTALIKEIEGIKTVNKLIQELEIKNTKNYRIIRLHSIKNELILSSLGRISKMNADWDFLVYLKDVGRQAADDWLKTNYSNIGHKQTLTI
jgi:NTE family protein